MQGLWVFLFEGSHVNTAEDMQWFQNSCSLGVHNTVGKYFELFHFNIHVTHILHCGEILLKIKPTNLKYFECILNV